MLLLLAGQTTPGHAFRAASSVRSTERSTSARTTSARGDRRGLRQRIRGLRGRLTGKLRRARVKRPAPIRAKIKPSLDSTLGSLGRHLRRSDAGNEGAARQNLRQRCTKKMQRLGHCVMEGARKLGRGIKQVKPKQAMRKLGLAVKKGARWSKAHPGKALGIGLGTCAMFATAFCVAPALSAGVAGCLAPTIGQTAASVVGTASGGALACGARSLLVHSTPMVLGVDPFNARQLGTDVSLSSTFGFFGFAQAAFLKSLGAGLGLSGLALFGANAVGLIGYEIGKDYLQNRIRNRVATDPKKLQADLEELAADGDCLQPAPLHPGLGPGDQLRRQDRRRPRRHDLVGPHRQQPQRRGQGQGRPAPAQHPLRARRVDRVGGSLTRGTV